MTRVRQRAWHSPDMSPTRVLGFLYYNLTTPHLIVTPFPQTRDVMGSSVG